MGFSENLNKLVLRGDLTYEEASESFALVLSGKAGEMDQGAFLAAITAKGPAIGEVRAIWDQILELDTNLADSSSDAKILDNSGTGMDRIKTFNISTAAAIAAASLGARIARHGSRAISSKCGTVDLLERLGVDVNMPVGEVARCVDTVGIGAFNGQSPLVHPRALGRILSKMSFASVLNIAASLANPMRPKLAVRGVYDKGLIPMLMELYRDSGFSTAMAVCGLDEGGQSAIDEASCFGPTPYGIVRENGEIEYGELDYRQFGLKRAPLEEIRALGKAELEAERFLSVLSGSAGEGITGVVAFNSALALYVGGVYPTIQAGVSASLDAIYSGLAEKKLGEWIAYKGLGLAAV
jgi:anthranilate phosphoribosyltransferase